MEKQKYRANTNLISAGRIENLFHFVYDHSVFSHLQRAPKHRVQQLIFFAIIKCKTVFIVCARASSRMNDSVIIVRFTEITPLPLRLML